MTDTARLDAIEEKINRLLLLAEVQIAGEKLHQVGGYAYGRTSDNDAFLILYPANPHLKHKVCRVYAEDFDKLPGFIDTAVPEAAQEGNPDREQAIRQKLYRPCPPFTIAVREGKETPIGREIRFSRVIEAPEPGPATRPPQPSAKAGHTAARPPQQPTQPQPAARPVAPGSTVVNQPLQQSTEANSNGRDDGDDDHHDAGDDAGQQPGRVVIEHDWKAEALASTDPLMFDSAYARWATYFGGDIGRIEKARLSLAGEWDVRRVGRTFEALEKYASMMTDLTADGYDLPHAHRMATEVARQIYKS